MSAGRDAAPGATRTCPHCRATILDSAVRCPQCQHHLRFDAGAAARGLRTFSPLQVEALLGPAPSGEAWEYSIVCVIRNPRGEEVGRQIMGVGAVHAGDERTVSLSVEVFAPALRAASPVG